MFTRNDSTFSSSDQLTSNQRGEQGILCKAEQPTPIATEWTEGKMRLEMRTHKLPAMIVAGLVLALGIDQARGQCPVAPDSLNELAKLTASDAAAGDHFGRAVSISGDVAVIGASSDDDAGSDSGSAYVFRFDGTNWNSEAKLTASDAAAGDFFGRSVSISGDVAVIGAVTDDAGSASGSTYVFRFDGSTWSEEDKLVAFDAEEGDRFGRAVSISGDVALIGAFGDDDGGSNSGSAYVFRYNGSTWDQEAKLTADDAEERDFFGGNSVAISGDVALIGADHNDDACPADPDCDSGSAYVFEKINGAWTQQAKLTALDAEGDDHFGTSVSISGDVVLIGAWGDDDAGSISGSAYVFERNEGGPDKWGQVAKLTAADAAAVDDFGVSVSISGDVAVIGADQATGAPAVGAAYVFQKPPSGWIDMPEAVKIAASDAPAQGGAFGSSVSISGDVAVIGRHSDDSAGNNVGSTYVFAGLGDCNINATLDICDIADCSSGDCNGNGVPDECEADPGCLCDLNGTCDSGESCVTCPCDCFSESSLGCGNGACEPSLGEDCMSCPLDCNGIQNGNPSNRFCCGNGPGGAFNRVGCDDPRCTADGFDCSNQPVLASCCGDGNCEGTEDGLNCAVDCAAGCVVPADCDDADPCTIEDCVVGVCVNDPIDCDDGNACTTDSCSGGVCVNDLIDCDDGDPCTADTCDPGSGCVNTFAACGLSDGCCGPACNPGNDPDCASCGAKNDPSTVDEDCCSLNCRPSGKCGG